jgi:hypothetical protein
MTMAPGWRMKTKRRGEGDHQRNGLVLGRENSLHGHRRKQISTSNHSALPIDDEITARQVLGKRFLKGAGSGTLPGAAGAGSETRSDAGGSGPRTRPPELRWKSQTNHGRSTGLPLLRE